jgi:MFS family permease
MDHEPPALAGSEKPRTLRVRDQITLSFFWFALNLQSAALLPIVIQAQITLFVTPGLVGTAQQAVVFGWLTALGAAAALVVQPIVGAISDRTPGRFGRRRPYIVVGTVLMLASVVALGLTRELSFFALGFIIFNIGNNASTAAYQGLLPDRVPESQHGTASGYLGLMTILGSIGSPALAGVLLGATPPGESYEQAVRSGSALFYALTSVVVLIGLIVTVVGIREAPLATLPHIERNPAVGVRRSGRYQRMVSPWLDPWKNQNFTWVVLTRAFVMLGINMFQDFILLYFGGVAHEANFIQQTAALAVLALVGAVVSSLVVGIVSDRVRRVPIVCVATVFMTIATVAFVIAPEKVPLWPLGIFFGLGYGAYASVDWALAVDSLPSLGSAGKDLGIWNIASALPAVLGPLLGLLFISSASLFDLTALGYRVVFGAASFFLLLGAAFVVRVRESRRDRDGGGASDTAETSTDEQSRKRGRRRKRRALRGWRLASRTGAGRAAGFLRFWPVWERITQFFHPVRPIPHAPYNLLLMGWGRYRGRPITLPDGTTVRSGDRVLELHMNNRLLARIPGGLALVRQARGDLAALAAWTLEPGYPTDMRAIYGFSMLSRGAPRLGFMLRDRRITVRVRLERFFLLGLMALYHGHGLERLREGTTFTHYPQEIWMSIAELRRRYGPAGTSA